MNFKKIITSALAAFMAVNIMVTGAFADPAANTDTADPANTDTQATETQAPVETQPTETQPTETQPVETQPTQIVTDAPTEPVTIPTQITTFTPPEPTVSTGTISLKVSEVKDLKFTVDIMVDCPKKIANAQFSIGYDELFLKYEGCEHNPEAGGMAVENSFDGKFVYNYVNPEGTNFTGSFCTVTFSVIDEALTSTVLTLSVNDLSNENAVTIPCQAKNGIVTYAKENKEEDEASEYREVNVLLSNSPYTPEDFIAGGDIRKVLVEDETVMKYSDGKFTALKAGETKVDVIYEDESITKILVKIEDDTSNSVAETTAATTAVSSDTKSEKDDGTLLMVILIVLVVFLGVGLVVGEYYFIVKKHDKNDDEFDEKEYNARQKNTEKYNQYKQGDDDDA